MTGPSLDHCYRVLELDPGASPAEIKKAYLRLVKLYSGESRILQALTPDFPAEKRTAVLHEIEDCYQTLVASFGPTPESPRRAEGPAPGGLGGGSGARLKERREARGLSLQDINQVIKVRVEILGDIESENYAALPDESFLRNHLTQLARHLGVEPRDVVEDYLERYREWRKRWARAGEADRKKSG
jgi:hypothetical protein